MLHRSVFMAYALFYPRLPLSLPQNILDPKGALICEQPYAEPLPTYWVPLLRIYEPPGNVLKI